MFMVLSAYLFTVIMCGHIACCCCSAIAILLQFVSFVIVIVYQCSSFIITLQFTIIVVDLYLYDFVCVCVFAYKMNACFGVCAVLLYILLAIFYSCCAALFKICYILTMW